VSTPKLSAFVPYKNNHRANPYSVQEWYRDQFEALAAHYLDVEVRIQVKSTALASRKLTARSLPQELFWANPEEARLP